jgi:hypothetical protein
MEKVSRKRLSEQILPVFAISGHDLAAFLTQSATISNQ